MILPLTQESETPSEKVRKTSGDVEHNKQAFVNTSDMVVNKGTTNILAQKKIDIVHTASNKTEYTPKSDKTDTVNTSDKSKSNLKNDTENTVDKPWSILGRKISSKSTIIDKHSEIDLHRDTLSVSSLSGQEESVSSVTRDIGCTTCKNKRKTNQETPYVK